MQEDQIVKQISSLTPDVLIDFYEIDFSLVQDTFEQLKDLYNININNEPIYRFCGMINGTNPVVWLENSYQPLPVKMSGFDQNSNGRLPRPKFAILNIEGALSKIVHSNNDFVGCKVTRKRTFVRFLDSVNFQGGVNPFGNSNESMALPDEVYYINKKNTENRNYIEFELVSALEMEGNYLPARVVLSNHCSWKYRCSIGCGYSGLAIESSRGQDLTQGFAYQPELKLTDQTNYQTGSVDPNRYPRGTLSSGASGGIPEWNKYGAEYINGAWVSGSESNPKSYALGDLVRITPKNAENPYKSVVSVFVCIQQHSSPHVYHPYFSPRHWVKDECTKTVDACAKRFSKKDSNLARYNLVEQEKGLRFGGFPGTEHFPLEG